MSRANQSTRELVRRRLARAGLDIGGNVTEAHRTLARSANVEPPPLGRYVEDWICYMTQAEATNLLHCARLRT